MKKNGNQDDSPVSKNRGVATPQFSEAGEYQLSGICKLLSLFANLRAITAGFKSTLIQNKV